MDIYHNAFFAVLLASVIDQIQGANHLPPVDSIPNMLDRLNRRTVEAS